jgi:hypothetical protein
MNGQLQSGTVVTVREVCDHPKQLMSAETFTNDKLFDTVQPGLYCATCERVYSAAEVMKSQCFDSETLVALVTSKPAIDDDETYFKVEVV